MTSISYTKGDLLTSDERVIAHGCNTRGRMGAGIAGQVAARFPRAKQAYMEAVMAGDFRLGSAQRVFAADALRVVPGGRPGVPVSPTKEIYNLGTQREPGADATEWGVFLSFANMAESCFQFGIQRVGIPRIGCGIGGLTWEQVAPRIERAIAASSHPSLEIVVYDFVQAGVFSCSEKAA